MLKMRQNQEELISFFLKGGDDDDGDQFQWVHHIQSEYHNLQIHLDWLELQSQKCRSDDDAKAHMHPDQQHQLMLRQEMDD
jgi:hypothetical protein